jgi:group I intron endonuclease
MKEYYVYCTTNILNNRKYIGSHTGYINDSYLGSGVILKKAIKKYGKNNFVKDILWEGPKEHMRDMETYWCEYFNVANNELFYNRTNKGTGYTCGTPNPKLSKVRKSMNISAWNKGKPGTMLGKKHTEISYKKLFWERTKVKCEFCDKLIGINNIKVHIIKKHLS